MRSGLINYMILFITFFAIDTKSSSKTDSNKRKGNRRHPFVTAIILNSKP